MKQKIVTNRKKSKMDIKVAASSEALTISNNKKKIYLCKLKN